MEIVQTLLQIFERISEKDADQRTVTENDFALACQNFIHKTCLANKKQYNMKQIAVIGNYHISEIMMGTKVTCPKALRDMVTIAYDMITYITITQDQTEYDDLFAQINAYELMFTAEKLNEVKDKVPVLAYGKEKEAKQKSPIDNPFTKYLLDLITGE